MMKDSYVGRYRREGMRVNRNVYNRQGALVIPAFTLLTSKEIDLLDQLRIGLDDEDVEPGSVVELVDSAISEIKTTFEKIRHSDRIPYDDIRRSIIPKVMQISEQIDLKPIFIYLEQHDDYTYKHSIGVAMLAKLIGGASGLGGEELQELMLAGLLHDIGKTKVSPSLLNKPDKLTAEEFEQIKRHTVYGFELIANTRGMSRRLALAALQHHERENGSGYPYGLKGEDIDPHSKMIAVADVFHAMISKRVYKAAVPFHKALQALSELAYGSLDPTVTLRFVKQIMDLAIGNRVVLSNGLEGKIILVSADAPAQPLVEVNGTYIDLSKEHTIGLERII